MSEQKKYETKELSGSAFRNKRKQKDTHPDFTGEARIEGKLYWVNIWTKTTQGGDPWFSFNLKEKEERQPELSATNQFSTPVSNSSAPAPSVIDDDVPF